MVTLLVLLLLALLGPLLAHRGLLLTSLWLLLPHPRLLSLLAALNLWLLLLPHLRRLLSTHPGLLSLLWLLLSHLGSLLTHLWLLLAYL